MCLEVTCVIEPRPVNMEAKRDSGPRQSKLCLRKRVCIIVVIRLFSITCSFSATRCVVYEHQLKQNNTARWDAPVFSGFNTAKSRLATFSSWPYNALQTPQKLAEAGFFSQVCFMNRCCLL
jgi:hypothetical protein